jgi:WD40 repeat protein
LSREVDECKPLVPGTGSINFGILFSGGEDHAVRVWRANDSHPLCTLRGHTDWVTALVISHDNNAGGGSTEQALDRHRLFSGFGFWV